MNNDLLNAAIGNSLDFKATFNALPGCFMLIKPDAPDYTILAISDDLLQVTHLERPDVVGQNLFIVFPENQDLNAHTGLVNLKASLERVVRQKSTDRISVLRYQLHQSGESVQETYWSVTNKPFLNQQNELEYIIYQATDITRQVEADKKQQSLIEKEKTYDLFMQAPVAVCLVTGPDNRVEFANKEMLKLLDRSASMVGKPLFEVLPEIKNQGFPELINQVRTTGQPFFATEHPATLLINGKEAVGYYNFIYQPYFDTNVSLKNPAGVFMVAHNVTEQVLTRKNIEEVKDYLNFRNALFEAQNEVTPDGVLVVDKEGRMLLHNKLFVEIWKMPQEVIDSKNDQAALEHAMTQIADPEGYIARVKTLYAEKPESAYDELIFRDGRVVERYGKPIIADNGEYYGWAWYFRNITDRIRQEHKFRNVVEQSPDPILILKGEDLLLEVANQALLELWQVGPEALNQPFLHILPEMKDQGIDQLLLRVMHTGEGFHGYEMPFVFKRKSGIEETRYFNFNYQPYQEANGSITGILVIASDVTKEVTIKKHLLESESRFQNLVMSAPVAMAVFRGDNFIAEIVNDAYLPLVGKTREEFAGRPLFESLPEAREVLEPLAQELVRTGKRFPANEFEITLNRNGQPETCYFNSVWQPLYEPDGRINGFIVVAHDITGQVVARKRVEESEQQVRSFVESAPMPIGVYVGREMRIQFANKSIIDAWGKGKEVIGKLYSEVLPELANQGIFDQLNNVYTTGKPYHAKNQKIIFENNGELQTHYFNYSFTPLYHTNGSIYGVMNTAANVTDLIIAHQQIAAFAEEVKESEQRFRIMADAAPNLVWALHPDSSIRYVNKSFLDFLGISLDQFISENWMPYIHPEDLEPTIESITEAIRTNQLFAMELRMRRHDGNYRWLLSQGSPSYFPNGDLYGYVGSAIDITDLKEAKEALALQNVQLTRTNNDLDNFVYTASHDLRTPITNIEALSSLLKDELLDTNALNSDSENLLNRVIDSVHRFKRTLDDLTQISRLQKDLKDGLPVENLHIPEVYQEIIADLCHYHNCNPYVIHTNFQVSTISFSRKNFRSILYNLISNAIKYHAPDRPGVIEVNTFAENNVMVLQIKDNGLGMSKRQQEKLYTMFKRFHDHVEGTGIGLYMVKRIIENTGGFIFVNSEEGIGTEFKVYFKDNVVPIP